MSTADRIEKLVKKFCNVRKSSIAASDRLDKRILNDALTAYEKSKNIRPADTHLNIWRTIAKSRIAKITAAAVIIIASCLFLTHQSQNGEIKTQQITQTAKSPTELTTFASLTFAYHQGGMKRVEEICDKALKMAGPQPAEISVRDLLEDFNGKIQKGQNYEK